MEFKAIKTRLFCVYTDAGHGSDDKQVFIPGIVFPRMYSSGNRTKERGKEKWKKLGAETGEGSQAVMDEHRLQRKNESAGIITKMTKSRDGGFMASKDDANVGEVKLSNQVEGKTPSPPPVHTQPASGSSCGKGCVLNNNWLWNSVGSSYAAHSIVNVWSQNYVTTFLDVNTKAVEKNQDFQIERSYWRM